MAAPSTTTLNPAAQAGGDAYLVRDIGAAWATSTAYAVGDVRTAGGAAYRCTTAGTSASSGAGPSGTTLGTPITDGTAAWIYAGAKVVIAQSVLVDPSGTPLTPVTGATSTAGILLGSTATGAYRFLNGPGTLYGADIVSAYGTAGFLVLMDRASTPAAGDNIEANATGTIAVAAAGANATATRAFVSGRKITSALWGAMSSSITTLTFMHATTDSGRVIVDLG